MVRENLSKLKYFFIRKTIKYIVWDFDGTLYKSTKLGHDLRLEFFNLARENNKKISLKTFDLFTEKYGSWSAAASKLTKISEEKILDIVDKKIDKNKYIKKNLNLVKFIESTQGRYHHLILTNSTQKEVISSLGKIGFDTSVSVLGPFEKIFSRDTTHFLKPNIKLYKIILKFTGALKFRHIFIGDSYSHDINPARSFGFKAYPIWELDKIFSI